MEEASAKRAKTVKEALRNNTTVPPYVFKGDNDQEGGYDGPDLAYKAYNAGLSPSSRQCQ